MEYRIFQVEAPYFQTLQKVGYLLCCHPNFGLKAESMDVMTDIALSSC